MTGEIDESEPCYEGVTIPLYVPLKPIYPILTSGVSDHQYSSWGSEYLAIPDTILAYSFDICNDGYTSGANSRAVWEVKG